MQIYKVGGAVRDRLLGRPVSEVDWVVVGATTEQMQALGYRPVGADFPVFLHPKTGEEYALARTERKSGRGYGGFTFYASPDVSLEDDLIRRDLTINAMAEDDHGNVIDPYGGQRDLEAKVLRHASPAFAEDPLRVLRVARFAARYAGLGFVVAEETLLLMRQLAESGELQALTPERSWKEISRALMEPNPEVFIRVLHDCGALRELLPELDALFDSPATQAPATGELVLEALRQCAQHQQSLPVRWACLLHAIGEGQEQRKDSIKAINARCKVPRDCQELASLVSEHHEQVHQAEAMQAGALFELLQHFDIYRRPERFEQFLSACEMIARAQARTAQTAYPQAAYLRAAATAARAVDAKPLIEQGYKGAELGQALQRERLEAIREFTQANS